ncbi:type II toxin-antitoxin system prevent-host-death family antitoxin [Empedobacter sp. 225-1]|uniref:type II toxin-antitoxin system prevent-host-death family antitoxin n=1 Tax=Empedobacter sp. 225-1 TaxID=2746725 RepID=UPI0025774CC9|nr:type II toxin-antitoxin system prevent-host-death family antitoxin [Empedobacter sp. 225-1]MDM1523845.1 type II toxin-antitoxin system prevent-host-death family antitoxin [Empedobacter sp. 225-1]
MIVISTREFREKQGQFLKMVKEGEDVIVKSRDNGSFKLVPISEDDTLMSKEDFFKKLDRSLQQAKEGKTIKIESSNELKNLIDSL